MGEASQAASKVAGARVTLPALATGPQPRATAPLAWVSSEGTEAPWHSWQPIDRLRPAGSRWARCAPTATCELVDSPWVPKGGAAWSSADVGWPTVAKPPREARLGLPWQKVHSVFQVGWPAVVWQAVQEGPSAPSSVAPWQVRQAFRSASAAGPWTAGSA